MAACNCGDNPPGDGVVPQDGGGKDSSPGDAKGSDRVAPPSDKASDAGPSEPPRPPDATKPDATKTDAPVPDTNRPFGLTQRVPNTTCKVEGQPADDLTSMKLVRVYSSLSFSRPLYLTYPKDGTDRVLVVEQAGRIYIFPNKHNLAANERKLFLDIRSKVSRGGNEEGLLGLAFHPNYRQNRYFYVYYSAASPRRSVLSRFQTKANDPNSADPNSEFKLMEVPQFASNHNGGMIEFGPDGYLYIALGDGGGGGDPRQNGQNLNTLLGSILRIDVDAPSGGKKYTVPKDNPFVGKANAQPEIWAYGLRNVWRFSFDRDLGTLWAGDVGQRAREEVDIIEKGGNYGWNTMEGFICYSPSSGCDKTGKILPIVDHERNESRSITGGYVYRGNKVPSLYGAYIYGDYATGIIWALRYDVNAKKILSHKKIATGNGVASFGEDRDGEIYVISLNGQIYRFEASGAPPTNNFPTSLSKTGCFKTLKPLVPADGLIPYDVRVPLWSDGLDKQRWIALPGTGTIGYKKDDGWDFPDGTVLLKHFSHQNAHVETRLLVKQGGDWKGYTYQWNAAQTDATLVAGRTPVAVGGALKFTHTLPSREDCMQCHTSLANRVLGLQTSQMNRDFDYKGVVDNQLRAMDHIKLFNPALPAAPSTLPKLPSPSDAQQPAAAKARAYLHANCSFCHRPGSVGNGTMDLRFSTAFKDTKTCNATPQEGTLGVAGGLLLIPKKPDQSMLYHRMKLRGLRGQMPPVGSVREDAQATALIRSWIMGLQSCP